MLKKLLLITMLIFMIGTGGQAIAADYKEYNLTLPLTDGVTTNTTTGVTAFKVDVSGATKFDTLGRHGKFSAQITGVTNEAINAEHSGCSIALFVKTSDVDTEAAWAGAEITYIFNDMLVSSMVTPYGRPFTVPYNQFMRVYWRTVGLLPWSVPTVTLYTGDGQPGIWTAPTAITLKTTEYVMNESSGVSVVGASAIPPGTKTVMVTYAGVGGNFYATWTIDATPGNKGGTAIGDGALPGFSGLGVDDALNLKFKADGAVTGYVHAMSK